MTSIQLRKPAAAQLLDEQMAGGREVLEAVDGVRNRPDFDSWRRDQNRWLDITKDALRHIYGGDTEAEAFEEAATHRGFVAGGDWPRLA